MIERLCFYEAFPPRNASLVEVTGMLRVLASRPHYGLRRLQPVVVLELWLQADRTRWLVGIEDQIARTLPAELVAQLPGLVLVPVKVPNRPAPVTAREVRLTSMIYPLRTDTALAVSAGLFKARQNLRSGEALVLQWSVGPSHTSTSVPISTTPLDLLGITTPRQPSGDEQRAWKTKLTEPLLGVRGRLGAVAANARRGAELLRPAVSAVSLAGGAHARVHAAPQSSVVAAQLVRVMGRVRTWSSIVNAAELAALLCWCLGDLDFPGGPSAFAPPPSSLLHAGSAQPVKMTGRPLGLSTHPAGQGGFVSLPRASVNTHAHVIGPSGRGKSTLLAPWALAEAATDSMIVIEPKGDLVEDILSRLPQDPRQQVVVIEPGADGPVVGINPLAGSRLDAERRADNLLHLMRQLFGTAIGPRSADVLWHALVMAARLDDATLADVPVLLTSPAFRRWAASKVSDPLTIGPWLAWFDQLSDAERGQVVAPVLNKLRPFTARPAIRRLLGQAQPKFDLATVFSQPTLLLVNLNAGLVGAESARLIGSLLLNELWQLIQRQTTLPLGQRRPVSVMVDEFQIFLGGLDFADALARARGANTSFVLSHQVLAQLGPELRAAVLGNVGTRIAFRPAVGDGRALAQVLGNSVAAEDLERLAAYHAVARVMVDGAPSSAFEVATPPLPPAGHDSAAVRRANSERYGADPATLDAALLQRWQGSDPPDGPVGFRRLGP